MQEFCLNSIVQWVGQLARSLLGAVTFYTIISLPPNWRLDFARIARWSPAIGLLIASLLSLIDLGLQLLTIPMLTRSAIIVSLWVALTGGLHLDGVSDAADGLATTDPERRLDVMRDSQTGAFGAIAIAIVLLLKTAALSDLSSHRWLALMLAAGWGRWAQVCAIAFYPYLRETGKGAFHKESLRTPQDLFGGFLLICALSFIYVGLYLTQWWLAVVFSLAGGAIAILVGYWFYRQLNGHTGDTYGAVVEVRFVG